jgi:hypothetical protein
MSAPIISADGNWMWTGSEWIPAPPNSETDVSESLNHVGNDSLSKAYHLSADKNSKYKITVILISMLSLFFPYLDLNLSQESSHKEGENFIELAIFAFTVVLGLSLPYMVMIITFFVAIKIFFGHFSVINLFFGRNDSPRTAGFVQMCLSLVLLLCVIVSYAIPEGLRLGDLGLGYAFGLTSGILLFVKGRFCPIAEE